MMATFENRLNWRKGKQSGDLFKLDIKNKTPEENVIEIIHGLYVKKNHNDKSPTNKNVPQEGRSMPMSRSVQHSSSDSRRLSYLNALVTLLCKEDRNTLGFTSEELMTCIRISLVDESMVVRAAALRVLRYLIKSESDVATFNTLKFPYLVTRSMDLMLRNEEERAQALRVVRRVIAVVGAASAGGAASGAGGAPGPARQRGAFLEPGLLRCLAAIARAGNASDGSGDRLSRPAIATLAEIGVINPALLVWCGGVGTITRYLGECATPRQAEALCGVLLHLLDAPHSRRVARLDLRPLCAPYCDFHLKPNTSDSTRDEREMRFTCSRLTLLCVLRSWPGVLHFCHPYTGGGLKALVQALHLPRLEVRKAILDLLYELLGLPQPEWTDEISVALGAVDPSDFQDAWRLNEGFVAAEGVAILPHLDGTGVDLTDVHLALLLQCFLEAGLLDGLAEVIITSDTFISVRATVLLGQLLHLVHTLLPPQICNLTPPLPALIAQATAGKPQALAAVAALKRLHNMLENRPASYSLFLDHIIQYCSGAFKERAEDTSKSKKEKDNASMASPKPQRLPICKDNSIEVLNESDNENEPKQRHSIGSRADVGNRNVSALVKSKSVSSRTSAAVSKVTKAKFFNLFERESDSLIRSSLVMQNKDGNTWNWEMIRTILKEHDTTPFLNLNDSGHKAWVARIINYLRPSSNKYSHGDLTACYHGHSSTRAACHLIRHLLKHNDPDTNRLLQEFFADVSRQVVAIETGRKAHECLFSPQHMCNTMCQMYFLFIGQLCHTRAGLALFNSTDLFRNLLELSTNTHHSCYVKLVISSLDYTLDSYPREILAQTLTCNIQASRLYTTQFLNVLLRASQKSRELVRKKMKRKYTIHDNMKRDDDSGNTDMETWILQMLVGQIKDESKAVVKCALSILEEASSVPSYLEKLISMKDKIGENCRLSRTMDPQAMNLHLSPTGDRGYILWIHLEAAALAHCSDAQSVAFVKKHLDYWTRFYNYRYVRLVECEIHGALTLCGGWAAAAAAGEAAARARPAALPPAHLHRALPPSALALLHATLPLHYQIIKQAKCSNEQEIMEVKASLWAMGHTMSSRAGLQAATAAATTAGERGGGAGERGGGAGEHGGVTGGGAAGEGGGAGGVEGECPLRAVARVARRCPVYSVRAAALHVLSLLAGNAHNTDLLQELGWLAVRHTRHEQFPIIDEINRIADTTGNLHYLVTSPHRRRFMPRNYDIEVSEHSDHSTIESLHSDQRLDRNHDTVDAKTPQQIDKRKSHTLPSQGYSSHERPLTESRTVDILRDYSFDRPGPIVENRLLVGRMNSFDAHEGRVRNTSESSTSGVSSCDSVLGRYVFPERVVTLSPIPSSSSLYGMKGAAPRARLHDPPRRVSAASFSTPDVMNSPPTQKDMVGYATLKSLNKHRRPHLSESAATPPSELEELSWMLSESTRRSKPFSSLRDKGKAIRERIAKMSVLEYDWKPLCGSEGAEGGAAARRGAARAARGARPGAAHYRGVCLPARPALLFAHGDAEEAPVDGFAADTSFLLETSAAAAAAAAADDKLGPGSLTQHSFTKGSSITNVEPLPVQWQHRAQSCLGCVTMRPRSALELREAFFAELESPRSGSRDSKSPSPSAERPAPRSPQSEVLHHAHYMANPIHHRQTRPALITLKQRYPEVFKSVCVYSEVCALLGSANYMMCARRFLQELFLDVSFESFTQEPRELLARRQVQLTALAPLAPLPPTPEGVAQ